MLRPSHLPDGESLDGALLARLPGVGVAHMRNAERMLRRPSAPTISVVIPTLDEEENLPFVLPRIPASVHEVILVDGRSTDATVEVALKLLPGIRIVNETQPGKGAALRAGFAACTGDIIVMLDADGSTDPGEIPLFVGGLLAGADFIKGSRFAVGGGTADMSFHRKVGNWCFVLLTRVLFRARFSDLCYGYNAFWADVIDPLDLDATGFEVETMMNIRAHRAGLSIIEVPSFEYRRHHGEGRLRTFSDGWRVLKTIFRERFRRQPDEAAQPAIAIQAAAEDVI
jgi:glycosyltransferase involved in cell wall biosynthesis